MERPQESPPPPPARGRGLWIAITAALVVAAVAVTAVVVGRRHAAAPAVTTAARGAPGDAGSGADAGSPPAPSAGQTVALRYRVPVKATDIALGPPDALVTIVQYTDVIRGCGPCVRMNDTLAAIQANYPDDVRIITKLTASVGSPEPGDVEAVYAAVQQGAGAAFLRSLRDLRHAQPGPAGDPTADTETIAKDLGLNLALFRADRDRAADTSDGVLGEAQTLEVDSAPTLFLNGHRFVGDLPEASITRAVEAELVVARQLVSTGTARTAVYDTLMRDAATHGTAASPL